jgi:hypothetical protein
MKTRVRLRSPISGAPLALCAIFAWVGPASAQFETRDSFPSEITPLAVVAADFNRDGKMDLAVASVSGPNGPEVQVFLGNGDGTFGEPRVYDVGPGSGPLAVADLNHDGDPDLVVVNGACPNNVCYDSVSVLLGNGDGTFQPPANYATAAGPVAILLGNFNGDGKLDIATLNQSDYTSTCDCLSVLLGNGDGTFQEPPIITYPPPSLPEALAAGHFNGGKSLDLAVTLGFTSQDTVQILLGNGDGTFQLGESYTVAPNSLSIVAADFRNNRKTDLAVAEFEGLGVAVLLGNGDGTFAQPVVYDVGIPIAVAADMNGDGITDLVAASDNPGGAAAVLFGTGNGTFQGAVYYPAGVFPSALAIADFNGDRRADVTVADQLGNREYVLLNTGLVSLSPTTPLNFNKQKTGATSAPQTVTLTNTGANALRISSLKTTGQFGMTSTCGSSVAAGGSCVISATFSPKSKGAKSGTVTIDDSASSKPMVIELSGTGT